MQKTGDHVLATPGFEIGSARDVSLLGYERVSLGPSASACFSSVVIPYEMLKKSFNISRMQMNAQSFCKTCFVASRNLFFIYTVDFSNIKKNNVHLGSYKHHKHPRNTVLQTTGIACY